MLRAGPDVRGVKVRRGDWEAWGGLRTLRLTRPRNAAMADPRRLE